MRNHRFSPEEQQAQQLAAKERELACHADLHRILFTSVRAMHGIMPDGYSVDLDQFHGLDQNGEEGLKNKVNNHYFEIFGSSIALDVISGAGQIAVGGHALTCVRKPYDSAYHQPNIKAFGFSTERARA